MVVDIENKITSVYISKIPQQCWLENLSWLSPLHLCIAGWLAFGFLTYLFKVQQVYSLVFLKHLWVCTQHLKWNFSYHHTYLPHLSLSWHKKKLLIHTSTLRKTIVGLTDRHCSVSTTAVIKAPWNKDILFIFVWHLASQCPSLWLGLWDAMGIEIML